MLLHLPLATQSLYKKKKTSSRQLAELPQSKFPEQLKRLLNGAAKSMQLIMTSHVPHAACRMLHEATANANALNRIARESERERNKEKKLN